MVLRNKLCQHPSLSDGQYLALVEDVSKTQCPKMITSPTCPTLSNAAQRALGSKLSFFKSFLPSLGSLSARPRRDQLSSTGHLIWSQKCHKIQATNSKSAKFEGRGVNYLLFISNPLYTTTLDGVCTSSFCPS